MSIAWRDHATKKKIIENVLSKEQLLMQQNIRWTGDVTRVDDNGLTKQRVSVQLSTGTKSRVFALMIVMFDVVKWVSLSVSWSSYACLSGCRIILRFFASCVGNRALVGYRKFSREQGYTRIRTIWPEWESGLERQLGRTPSGQRNVLRHTDHCQWGRTKHDKQNVWWECAGRKI